MTIFERPIFGTRKPKIRLWLRTVTSHGIFFARISVRGKQIKAARGTTGNAAIGWPTPSNHELQMARNTGSIHAWITSI
jgi:hypothetical protein